MPSGCLALRLRGLLRTCGFLKCYVSVTACIYIQDTTRETSKARRCCRQSGLRNSNSLHTLSVESIQAVADSRCVSLSTAVLLVVSIRVPAVHARRHTTQPSSNSGQCSDCASCMQVRTASRTSPTSSTPGRQARSDPFRNLFRQPPSSWSRAQCHPRSGMICSSRGASSRQSGRRCRGRAY